MNLQTETLKAILRDYHGFELSDEEFEQVRPELDNYVREVEKLRQLDLSQVMSSRLLHAQEGGSS